MRGAHLPIVQVRSGPFGRRPMDLLPSLSNYVLPAALLLLLLVAFW